MNFVQSDWPTASLSERNGPYYRVKSESYHLLSGSRMQFPLVQVALDVTNIDKAIAIAVSAEKAGVSLIEAGTPLIKSRGIDAISLLRRNLRHDVKIVADMKTMDAGRIEVELAIDAKADIISICGLASESTVVEAIRAGRDRIQIMLDLLNHPNPIEAAKKSEELGADYVCLHTGLDEQRQKAVSASNQLHIIGVIASRARIPVAVAGGIKPQMAASLLDAGAKILIVGSYITSAMNARDAASEMLQAVKRGWKKRI